MYFAVHRTGNPQPKIMSTSQIYGEESGLRQHQDISITGFGHHVVPGYAIFWRNTSDTVGGGAGRSPLLEAVELSYLRSSWNQATE